MSNQLHLSRERPQVECCYETLCNAMSEYKSETENKTRWTFLNYNNMAKLVKSFTFVFIHQ